MAEVIEFVMQYIHDNLKDSTDCARSGLYEPGRYVRESDYAALLERHRRLVSAAELKRNAIIPQGKLRAVFTGEWIAIPKDDFEALKAALAEEVE